MRKTVVRFGGAYSFEQDEGVSEMVDRLMESVRELSLTADGGGSKIETVHNGADDVVRHMMQISEEVEVW